MDLAVNVVKTSSTDQVATVDNHPIRLTIVPPIVIARAGIRDVIARIQTRKSKICLIDSTRVGDHWMVGVIAEAG
jgi:hypothetical protein